MRFRVVLLTLALSLFAFPVFAHGNLASSSPASNERLDESPDAIRMTFTEVVERGGSRITLFNLAGEEIASGGQPDAEDPFTLVLTLPDTLEHDIYTVAWRVLSAADGHTTQGAYSFGVGVAAGAKQVIVINETARLESVLARWLEMFAAALTVGVLAFVVLVWWPGLAQGLPDRNRQFIRLLRIGWVLFGLSLVIGLLAQGAIAAGASVTDALADGTTFSLLGSSVYGQLWLTRLALWVIFGVLVLRTRPDKLHVRPLIIVAILLTVLPSFISHARALGSVDALVNDMLHRVAATLWIGGLVAWVAALWDDLTLTTKPVSRAVTRFSNLARFYVLLLATGGLFAAIQHIPDGDALSDTAYGRAMAVKGLVFAVMFAIAGFNLLVVEPRLKKGPDHWIGTLRLTISAEMMLGGIIILLSAVMASTMPSEEVVALREQAAVIANAPDENPYFGMVVQDNVMLHLEIYPATAGENEFTVTAYDADSGEPLENISRLRLRFTHLEQDLGETVQQLEDAGEGLYQATGGNLSLPGDWRIRVTLQRPDAFDNVMDFELTIPLP